MQLCLAANRHTRAPAVLLRLYSLLTATTRICADGGANRLYDQLPAMLPGVDPSVARDSHLPDLIKGDLDSVRQDVTDFYTSKGIPFIDLSSDQETTDLEKCLLFLEGRLRAMSEDAARWSAAAHAPSAAVGSGHLHHKLAPGGCGATAGAAANTAARAPASDLLLSSSSSNSNGSSATPQHIGSSVTASLGLAPLTPGSNADGSSSNSQQQQPHGQISGEIVMLHDAPDQQQRLHNGRVSQESRSCLSHAGCTHSTAASAAAGNLDRNSSSDNGQQHAHEGTGSILASHDGVTVEHVKKRVHQEHQILVLGEQVEVVANQQFAVGNMLGECSTHVEFAADWNHDTGATPATLQWHCYGFCLLWHKCATPATLQWHFHGSCRL